MKRFEALDSSSVIYNPILYIRCQDVAAEQFRAVDLSCVVFYVRWFGATDSSFVIYRIKVQIGACSVVLNFYFSEFLEKLLKRQNEIQPTHSVKIKTSIKR